MTPRGCQCTNSDCNLVVELTEEVTREFNNPNWIMIAEGCLGSPPDGYKLIRRNITYNIYSSDRGSDIEGAIETADIVSDPETVEAIRQSEKDIEEGGLIPWEQVKRELDLD